MDGVNEILRLNNLSEELRGTSLLRVGTYVCFSCEVLLILTFSE